MMYEKEFLLNEINKIRDEIGHDNVNIFIEKIYFNENTNELWIITEDRPDKSAIIGKGGWVVGKLREKLGLESIHVESYGDFLNKEYKLKLSKKTVNNLDLDLVGLENLEKTIENKLENIYSFNFDTYFNENQFEESENVEAVVALSGGVDSSFSLILAKKLGFNPIAITVDPGTIILPKQFKNNIKLLTESLNIKHEYINADYSQVIKESFTGKLHPCGRCSKNTGEIAKKYAKDNKIPIIIFGDMLATGSQCINLQEDSLYRLNLPASLSVGKQEIKSLIKNYDLKTFKGFGCPLLYEVHKKFPYLKKFSIQRILRETRSGALEPGEALDLIWSFYK
ncbi:MULTISPECIES: 7-cyano-7-deazaguanine synthase [unclassified Methanobrevibacter]|uniref:7-cyano-7-deazaguanine synthase n=1 Tax=unclassified Methanobrevibacter TaxID=2638681 RepID=UPI0025EFB532|nr:MULTISPECIES: 7-cyano-7-deazaguanine synthase [unclassified Methanobrevibacter]MEE0942240.1 7-cyano-7-deazaguanine synthase [Methanobrevibacter sp.]